ncbi:DUF4349 domain-containing protein [Pedobacter sp. MC2016-14]|uniref:DUF4349 domain-containing protein n=1 Tax=Pedobacter sp. MC2016-14 TaxID=2897327 RepID=UPI001E307C30|nr:DUF4349 domain-containing protein [Pedobacter sp. MC2016-14]MCD0487668.1 DUF4349 domain-containing protein [Pedobacter sp. MC2016-14]
MKRNIIAMAMLIALFGCNSEKKSDYASADTIASSSETSDSTFVEKIIKTADMRFRVKDARKTKIKLSKLLKDFGGKLTSSNIESTIAQQETVKYSLDSLQEIVGYHTEGKMELRVPSDKLDEFTDVVGSLAIFIDHQSLDFNDKGLNYLSNELKAQNRVEAIENLNKKAVKKSNNVESAMYIKDDYIDKKVENLQIDDRVKLSTITLSFYQENTVTKMIVSNDRLSDFRPPFFRRLGLNLLEGWSVFTEVVLALAYVWVFIVLALAIYFGVKYYRNKRQVVKL